MALSTLIRKTYKKILKPLLFKLDPELVHDTFLVIGNLLGKSSMTKKITRATFHYKNPILEQRIAGITFKNPVGLSAGFDKDAHLINILDDVGFGFMQIGSVTLHPYKGNPKPRLYRLLKSRGIVVYYGLKNIGVEKIIKKLKGVRKENFPVGISVAKTNSSATADTSVGIKDYAQCLKRLTEEDIGDFYTINISCPNAFGGEPFTTPDKLDSLLAEITTLRAEKPIFVKMPINLSWNSFENLLKIIIKHKLTGVIIGNLNKDKNDPAVKDLIPANVSGGLSGKPTEKLSNKLISQTYQHYGEKLVIIGAGGIFSAQDAYGKIKRGASLVQLITGMIYEGPQLIGEINKGLAELLKKDGYKNISEATGIYYNSKVKS
jgi:dihydroorotate dehydrogenase